MGTVSSSQQLRLGLAFLCFLTLTISFRQQYGQVGAVSIIGSNYSFAVHGIWQLIVHLPPDRAKSCFKQGQ